MPSPYPALNTLLSAHPSRLGPDERRQLVSVLGRVLILEAVNRDAEALVDALPADLSTSPVWRKQLQKLQKAVRL